MIDFITTNTGVVFKYDPEAIDRSWVWSELQTHSTVKISKVFYFDISMLLTPPTTNQDFDNYIYEFQFGSFSGGYVVIPSYILNIPNDLYISKDIELSRSIFAAERNISIFGRLSRVLNHSNPIFIGGENSEAIPSGIFSELLRKFPNSYEVDRYADARVHIILEQYLEDMKDARGLYETYLNRIAPKIKNDLNLNVINELEIEKYTLIRDAIEKALNNKQHWSEKDWQKMMVKFLLLLFPKYILVIENITIPDYYSTPGKKTPRFIDIGLVDSNGNLDIIEVKKPFDNKILRRTEYRGNSIPTSELSGGIMQAEKYLFHLSKWGIKGEDKLTKTYKHTLPSGMSIHISNPKAIIIVGRDQIDNGNMTANQNLDFEIIKRKYTNMMDIITYDDILRRLNRTISALKN
ncbi:Shedu immune nuclease family protein [Citrobacter koseri]|uniref:Shedu immune nuclease family protein n=1 Tax=Citrobacter koseri TaxID=545 RepID=UPI0028BD789B|nr:Shedu immune nuclease family protein [Citrobacter koseri]MDT7458374.1 Shedu immune nuclease family protein [Citrobacter koseri]